MRDRRASSVTLLQVQSMSWFHNSQLREWVHGCVTAAITQAPPSSSPLPHHHASPPPSSKLLAAAAAVATVTPRTTQVVVEKAKVIVEVCTFPSPIFPASAADSTTAITSLQTSHVNTAANHHVSHAFVCHRLLRTNCYSVTFSHKSKALQYPAPHPPQQPLVRLLQLQRIPSRPPPPSTARPRLPHVPLSRAPPPAAAGPHLLVPGVLPPLRAGGGSGRARSSGCTGHWPTGDRFVAARSCCAMAIVAMVLMAGVV
jgi:hypothetical protein